MTPRRSAITGRAWDGASASRPEGARQGPQAPKAALCLILVATGPMIATGTGKLAETILVAASADDPDGAIGERGGGSLLATPARRPRDGPYSAVPHSSFAWAVVRLRRICPSVTVSIESTWMKW